MVIVPALFCWRVSVDRLGRTLRMLRLGAVCTVICVLFGYPLAYFLARASRRIALIGLFFLVMPLMVSAVAVGYRIGQPATVVQRINIWLSPWNNDVRGGDQLVLVSGVAGHRRHPDRDGDWRRIVRGES